MDTDTVAAIERVNTRIDALELTLRGEFRHGLSELRDELWTEFRSELRSELAEVRRPAVMFKESTASCSRSWREDRRGRRFRKIRRA